jgi:hypothetical protein
MNAPRSPSEVPDLMLNAQLALLIHRDRQREAEEHIRVRSLLDGRQPETSRNRIDLSSLLLRGDAFLGVALRPR